MLQKLVEAELGWDEPLKGELRSASESALIEMVSISFPRCVLGDCYAKQGWMLMGFWNGGRPVSACCLYAHTPLEKVGPNRGSL